MNLENETQAPQAGQQSGLSGIAGSTDWSDRLEEIAMALSCDMPNNNPYEVGTIESSIYELRKDYRRGYRAGYQSARMKRVPDKPTPDWQVALVELAQIVGRGKIAESCAAIACACADTLTADVHRILGTDDTSLVRAEIEERLNLLVSRISGSNNQIAHAGDGRPSK